MLNHDRRRVCHLTSAHPHRDIRIFVKECRTLAAAGYQVHLVAARAPTAVQDGVYLHGVAAGRGRLARMTQTVQAVYQEALAINADLYHFHDPELIPVGLRLRARGKRVIYDAHEDLPRDLLSKEYLGLLRRFLGGPIEYLENWASRNLSAVVAATPTIGARFEALNPNTVVVNNYPLCDELILPREAGGWATRDPAVAYIGIIVMERGVVEMVQAMRHVPEACGATLELAGSFNPPTLESRVQELEGWQRVRYHGMLDRAQVAQLLGRVQAGLILSHPGPNHVRSQPNKLFEYMSAGIPVIASDFPLWRQQIESIQAGMLVDPLDPRAIAGAIEYVLTHPQEAEAMGRRGREAVEKRYNWESESSKLLELYRRLLQSDDNPGRA